MAKKKVISDKHRRVADLYISNGLNNISDCYKQVYDCADSTARTKGSELLKRDDFNEYIQKQTARITTDAVLSAQQILEELSVIAMDSTVNINNRMRAMELIGKSKSMWVERVDQTVTQMEVVVEGLDIEFDDEIDE